MNDFVSVLESHTINKHPARVKRGKLTTLQVNLGNLCNQYCKHCHINASAKGDHIMERGIIDEIIGFLSRDKGLTLDITGGAPELNPNFEYLVESASPFIDKIIVRSNLTVLFEPGKEHLPEFFKKYNIHLICSLPCYTKENVNSQRGDRVFEKSIMALKLLNNLGFAKNESLNLDLVYNSGGATLPPKQEELERDYKEILKKEHKIEFNRLITITNMPINRFRDYLESNGKYEDYLSLLRENFNPEVLSGLMCRTFLSVGYDGKLYDCDFNQALCLPIRDKDSRSLTIGRLIAEELEGQDIILGDHCFACTAGCGSSCQGVLTSKKSVDLNQRVDAQKKKDFVKDYYGKMLQSNEDLKTSACCISDTIPKERKTALKQIHPEILSKFYGCGSPIPPLLRDRTVLDLGCGAGRDTYLVSQLVGPKGLVIGVDMTDGQLDVARKHIDFQMETFGFLKSNVEFKKGYIEDLKSIDIEDNSVDVVISNCVINLSPEKEKVFSEIFRILKLGGELYFSDVFTGRRMSDELESDPVLYGECLAGALYIEDFRRLLRKVGCLDYRVASKRSISLNNPEIESKAGMIDFYSMTIRAFKLHDLEDICEDYGEMAMYLGTIPGRLHRFALDDHHIFITDKPMLVCGNTASMLSNTRYASHFKVEGDRCKHYGLFDCAPQATKKADEASSQRGAYC